MFKEFTENTLSKAKEEVEVANWLIVLIAVVAFLTGLIVGILCAAGANNSKKKKEAFNVNTYVHDLDFDIDDEDFYDDDDEGMESPF